MTRLNGGSTKYNQLRINNRQMASFFAQWATVVVADLSEMIRIIQYLSWGFYDWNTFSSSRFTGLAMQIAETITKHSFWMKSHSPALCFDHQAVMQWSPFSFWHDSLIHRPTKRLTLMNITEVEYQRVSNPDFWAMSYSRGCFFSSF